MTKTNTSRLPPLPEGWSWQLTTDEHERAYASSNDGVIVDRYDADTLYVHPRTALIPKEVIVAVDKARELGPWCYRTEIVRKSEDQADPPEGLPAQSHDPRWFHRATTAAQTPIQVSSTWVVTLSDPNTVAHLSPLQAWCPEGITEHAVLPWLRGTINEGDLDGLSICTALAVPEYVGNELCRKVLNRVERLLHWWETTNVEEYTGVRT